MNSINPKLLLFVLIPFFSMTIQGQEDNVDDLPSEVISVVKAYEPVLAEAEKINFNPQSLQDTGGESNSFNDYFLPNRFLSMEFQPPSIKPVAMKRSRPETFRHFWVKAGFGNMKTPYLDLSANTKNDGRIVAGIQLKHIQSEGPIIMQKDQDSEGRIFASRTGDKSRIDAAVRYNRDRYYGYALHRIDPDGSYLEENYERTNQRVNLDLDYTNTENKYRGFDYKFNLSPYYFWAMTDDKETGIQSENYFFKNFDSGIRVGAELDYYYDQYSHPLLSEDIKNTLMNLTPKVAYNHGRIIAELGANLVLVNDESLQVAPDIYLEAFPIEKKLSVFAAWNKKGVNNSYHGLLEQNPYVIYTRTVPAGNAVSYQQIRDAYTESRIIGVKANVMTGLMASLQVGQFITEEQPLFWPVGVREPWFIADYESEMTRLSTKLGLDYTFNEVGHAGLEVSYNTYETVDNTAALYFPKFTIGLNGSYTFIEKLDITADFNLRTDLPYIDHIENEKGVISNQFDLNLKATYEILENLEVFLDLYNLTNNKYDRYINYPVYGTRVVGGIIARF